MHAAGSTVLDEHDELTCKVVALGTIAKPLHFPMPILIFVPALMKSLYSRGFGVFFGRNAGMNALTGSDLLEAIACSLSRRDCEQPD